MGASQEHLPLPYSEGNIRELIKDINFPEPLSILQLPVTAAYHIIYVLKYDTERIFPKLHAPQRFLKSSSHELRG